MKKSLKHIFVIGVMLLILGEKDSSAQKIDAFARISVSPREGVVRQPFKVIITVHSSTWFATPLQFSNLHIDDAFLIPFTRTVSSINYINNKKYATLSFYYLIFPYNTGTLKIPQLEINTSIPPEGGFKGEPTTIFTHPQNIKVEPLPTSKDEKVWMVAKNINLKENWNKPLDKLKVGDVIEREITITANGTLPSLIQPFEIGKTKLTSIYAQEPVLQDKRTSNDVNGVRIEKYAYLFEEEGELIIPAEEILWWNPQTKQIYKRTIQEQVINIAANPDLEIMQSLKDSLMAMTAPTEIPTEERTIPWIRISLIAILLLLIGYFAFRSIKYFSKKIRDKKARYFQSEFYFYQQMIKSMDKKSTSEFVRKMYIWFDKARKPVHDASINSYLNSDENETLESVIETINLNQNAKLDLERKKKLKLVLDTLRTKILIPERKLGNTSPLNPA